MMKKTIFCFLIICISFTVNAQRLSSQNLHSTIKSLAERVHLTTMYSTSLEGNLLGESPSRTVKIYLPPGYYEYPDNRYPVVYYLPAIESNTRSYNDPFYYCNVGTMLDELINKEEIRPMILVVPDSETDYDGALWVNSYVVGNWEDFVVDDLVAFVDSNYRTIPQKESRGLQGYGSGGSGALRIAMKYPSVFSVVGTLNAWILDFQSEFFPVSTQMLSAANLSAYNYDTEFPKGKGLDWFINVWQSCAANFAPDSTFNTLMGRMHIDTGGTRIDSIWEEYLMHDPVSLISDYVDSLKKLRHIQLDVDKIYVNTNCVPSANAYSDSLDAYGIPHMLNVSSLQGCDLSKKSSFPMFSEHFRHNVPDIHLLNTPWLDRDDTLRIATYDGFVKVFLLPDTAITAADSISKYAIDSLLIDGMGGPREMMLKDLPLGIYRVYGVEFRGRGVSTPRKFHLIENKPDFQVKVLDNASGETIMNCPVRMNETLYIQDSDKGLNFTGHAYGTVHLEVNKSNYFAFDTIFDLHADLSLDIYLESSIVLPELSVTANEVMDWNDFLEMTFNQNGLVYLTPSEVPANIDSIEERSVKSYPVGANNPKIESLYGIPPGFYRIYGISLSNHLAEESFPLTIIESFPDCHIEVFDQEWQPLDSCLLILNQTDSIPGIENRFDISGLVYDSCRISLSREGYSTVDTILVVHSDLSLRLQLSPAVGIKGNIEKDASFVGIYPNPASEKLMIERKSEDPFELILRNSNGLTIMRLSGKGSKSTIDISDFSPGIYFISIRTKKLILRQKFIKL